MTTYIIHADQEVVVKSRAGYWPVETLRSKPTFSIEAKTLDEAKKKAEKEVRERYSKNPDIQILRVYIGVAHVREVTS